MRILITTDSYYPRIGGAEVHVEQLSGKLKDKGHKVHVFTTEELANGETPDVTRVPWSKKNMIAVNSTLMKILDSFEPDLVAAHDPWRLATIAGLHARLRQIPMTVTLHGTGILPSQHRKLIHRLLDKMYRQLSLLLARRVISTSQDLANIACRYISSKRISIIPNGASGDSFNPARWACDPEVAALRQRYSGRKIILTVRRLAPKNGIQYLTEAMPRIVGRHPNVLHMIVGDGPLKDDLRRRIEELGLADHVVMTGIIPNSETPKYYLIADIVVFPSTAESTSIACIEAMMMGKAIVASRVGGLVELLGRDERRGRLVELFDWESCNAEAPKVSIIPEERLSKLSTTISDLLDDPEQCRQIGTAASEYAHQHFDWGNVTEKTLAVYRSCLGKGGRDPGVES